MRFPKRLMLLLKLGLGGLIAVGINACGSSTEPTVGEGGKCGYGKPCASGLYCVEGVCATFSRGATGPVTSLHRLTLDDRDAHASLPWLSLTRDSVGGAKIASVVPH